MSKNYKTFDSEFIGAIPIKGEIEILPHDPSVKGWTVEQVAVIDGNKYLKLLKKYLLKVNKASEDDLTSEEINNLMDQCEI